MPLPTPISLESHGRFETLRRDLWEWTCDDGDRILSWGPATEVDAAACFPELLHWVRDLWTPGAGEAGTEPPLVLALDPTHHRDEWVALVVSVAYRQHALPVAWHVVGTQVRESWRAHFCRLLRQLAPAVPAGTRVHVLCDQGLGSRDLWRQIVDLGWHPVLRYSPHITFRHHCRDPSSSAHPPPMSTRLKQCRPRRGDLCGVQCGGPVLSCPVWPVRCRLRLSRGCPVNTVVCELCGIAHGAGGR